MKYDVLIGGAGVSGAMIARELSRYQLNVCLLEKENDVACGASKANSGIIHGGFDPEPNTLKAKLNVAGVPLLYEAAEQLHVPHRKNGSMVCAFGADEEPAIDELYHRGLSNGVGGMEILSGEEARAIEPNLSEKITKVLHIPGAGIICPYELTIASVGNAMDNGVQLKRNFTISSIEKNDSGFTVISSEGETVEGKIFINCAGCHADKIAEMVDDKFYSIIPRAGEYLLLDKAEGQRVSHTIFQVPSKEGKGILVTPTVDNNLLCGPTAAQVAAPENTETTSDGLAVVQRLAAKSVPSVNFRQVITSFTGVRSSEKGGDFIVEASKKVKGFYHVAAIDSPGLSSCVAIAKYLLELLKNDGIELLEKTDWNGCRENPHAFRSMSDDEKNEYIKAHPAYGKIVCRCECVSEGEIRAALRMNPPALDLDGVKRRTRSGMGRCQGGFCSPYIMKLIAEEQNIPMENVSKNGKGSEPLLGKL